MFKIFGNKEKLITSGETEVKELPKNPLEKKIQEQLPSGISLKEFWECAKLYEADLEWGHDNKYKKPDLTGDIKDKVIAGTIANLKSLREELEKSKEYKGGI